MPDDASPSPRHRPKLAAWLFERDIDFRRAAGRFGVTSNAVRRWCLRFDDPERNTPGLAAMEKIVTYTGGDVRPADFYPPHLNEPREPGSAEPAEARP